MRVSKPSDPLVMLGALIVDVASVVSCAVVRGADDAMKAKDISASDLAGVNCFSFVHVVVLKVVEAVFSTAQIRTVELSADNEEILNCS